MDSKKISFFYECILMVVVCLLLAINSVDMFLTHNYIGNNWQLESTPTTQYVIRHYGIDMALAMNRITIYGFILLFLQYKHVPFWRHFLLLGTFLYYVVMFQWLFFLRILELP